MSANEIDEGVRAVVDLFNQMEGVQTHSSCEGHPRGGHIFFDSKEIPVWLEDVITDLTENIDQCFGCLRVEWGYRYYLDCGHTPIGYYYFEINPRYDMEAKKEDIDEIWKQVEQTLEKMVKT